MISSRSRTLLPLVIFLLLLLAPATNAGDNLVENPFFNPKGDDPVPRWTVRRVAGKTDFRIENGILVAERKAGSSTAADTILQMIYLPEDTRALRVAVRASPSRMTRAEVGLRFVRRDGSSGGHQTVFHFSGTHPLRLFEKDILLPTDTKDVEIAIRVYTPGRLLIDEAVVEVVDPDEVRGEARFVTVRGRFYVMAAGTERVESARLSLAIPPPTATQCPVSLTVRSEPNGRLRSITTRRETGHDRLDLVIGPLEPKYKMRVQWKMRIFLTDREGMGDLPDQIEIVPSRHLKRRISPFAKPPTEEGTLGFARRALSGSTDLLLIAEQTAKAISRQISQAADGPTDPVEVALARRGSPAGRANLAADIFRVADVPARPITFLPVGGGPGRSPAVLAFHPDFDWIIFALDPRAPRGRSRPPGGWSWRWESSEKPPRPRRPLAMWERWRVSNPWSAHPAAGRSTPSRSER